MEITIRKARIRIQLHGSQEGRKKATLLKRKFLGSRFLNKFGSAPI